MNLKEEDNKCLLCKNPRCSRRCPISTPIPEIIQLFKDEQLVKAGEILFENNPLSAICAIVCAHENQCMGNCIKGIKGEPVEFYEIEKYISSTYLELVQLKPKVQLEDRVAIVGSGPAGLTISFILAAKGYKVTLFESKEKIGGVLRYGIPEFRLPKKYLDQIEDKLIQLGVKIRPNRLIGSVLTIDKLFEDGYKAIFLGTSVWNPKRLNIKGESFGNAHYAIDYLKSPNVYRLGKKVCVIGAGNVPRNNIVSNTTGLDTDKLGLLLADETGHTTRDGVFASRDVVTGARTVVEAVNYAKIVAECIDDYCIKTRNK